MLIDKARKFYSADFDFNCAETIIYAADEEYNLKLSKDAFKTMAAFGGGMAVEGVC
jgi:C_GCAxxG_C_C family probable redox protein